MSRVFHRFEEEEQSSMLFEGQEAVKEIAFAVVQAELSSVLPSTDHNVYINLTTKEKVNYCIELSGLGFKIVGHKFDEITSTEESSTYYETIYALLNDISPLYRVSFSEALASKLLSIQNDLRHNNHDDE